MLLHKTGGKGAEDRAEFIMHVVITGGSRGIGAAAVRAFCRRGDEVSFFYLRSHEAAQALAAETGARAVQCDVADGQAVAKAFAALPPTDVLVANAGIAHYGLITQISQEEWDRLFRVNVDGVRHCVCAALPAMLEKQRGCILTVASMWGQVGASCEAAYSATKGAVIALTKSLAKELGPSHIRVNCVSPGLILTDMCASLSPDTLETLREETPLGRHGTPEDVAQALVYLSGAEFVTGQVLPVNGGFLI